MKQIVGFDIFSETFFYVSLSLNILPKLNELIMIMFYLYSTQYTTFWLLLFHVKNSKEASEVTAGKCSRMRWGR